MSDLQQKQFGKYQVKDFLGRGAMAEVYRAFHPTLERDVAIKVIHRHLAEDPDFVERFRSEAKIIATLRHPGIVQVYDFEVEDNNTLFMVMEYVPGESLSQFLAAIHQEGKHLTLGQIINLFRPMLEAVAYAHSRGIIHRDLKPANVLLNSEGRPILADFGLSKIIKAERLTQSGPIIGTPAYMSPEQGSGRPGDERSDIYSLGIILYEMTTGAPPFESGSPISIILKHLEEPPPPPRALQNNLPPPVEEIIQTALHKNPARRFQSAQEFLEQLNTIIIPPNLPSPTLKEIKCPYRGLHSFEEEHADYYFGREALIDQLRQLLAPINQQLNSTSTRPAQFLAVLGASGSGKSSLVQAGLIPAIRNDAQSGSNQWLTQVIKPGSHPLEALAVSVSAILEQEAQTEHFVYGYGLHQICSEALPAGQRLLLIVDQFEEIFTLCHNETERQRFIENLLFATAVNHGPVVVIITLRADFYHRCAAYRDLATRISTRQILVGRMEQAELRRAIEQPAQKVGLTFEAGLIRTILEDVARQPGALPLLQHALLELWERRDGHLLTLAGYRASGGVSGAITQRAESVYHNFSPAEQAIVRRIMLRLTQPGEGTEDTRRRAKKQELLPSLDTQTVEMTENVLQNLINARLITTGQDPNEDEDVVDVAHEALIRGWTRLRGWIDENRAALLTHRQLAEAAEAWQRNNQDESFLYQGARLAQATEWAEVYTGELNDSEWKFLRASQAAVQAFEQTQEAARQRELAQAQALANAEHQRAEIQTQANRRLGWLVVGLAIVFLAAVGAAIVARQQEQLAEQQANLALARQLAAQAIFLTDKQPDLALLLSLEAASRNPNPKDDDKLLLNLEVNPNLISFLHGHTDGVLGVSFSPNGKIIASSSRDRTIRLWDAVTGQPLAPPLEGHTRTVYSVAFSPNSQFLASASEDGAIRLWEVSSGQPVGEPLKGHSGQAWHVSFSADGQTLVSWGEANEIIFWDIATGQPLDLPLTDYAGQLKSVDYNPNNQIVAGGSEEASITIWDASTRKKITTLDTQHAGPITRLAFSPNGQMLASGGQEGKIILWNMTTRAPLRPPLPGHSGQITTLAFSPNGEILASGSEDKTMTLWDTKTGQPVTPPFTTRDRVSSLAFSPDGQTLASGIDDKTVILWDITDRRRLWGHKEWVDSVTFSPDGKMLASASDDDTIILWDVATRQPIMPPLTGHTGNVLSVAFNPSGKILASGSEDATIRLWDTATGQPLGAPLAGDTDGVLKVAFSPDAPAGTGGKLLASANVNHTITLWDVSTRQQAGPLLTAHTEPVLNVTFSPDGRLLASSSGDNSIILWDVATGQPIGQPLTGHTGWVWGLDFSPDGQTLASSGNDKTIRIWDVATGQPLGQPLMGHTDEVWGVTFHPNGKNLASSSRDNTIILWDVTTHQPVGPPLAGHTDWVWGLDFNPATSDTPQGTGSTGGQILASSSRDASIILWNVPLEDWSTRVCRMVNRNLTPSEWAEFIGSDIPYQNTCSELGQK